nr:MAG TPA: ECF sigma factor [Caudoviricetes sp.]
MVIFDRRLFLCPTVRWSKDGKDTDVKLKIRYENEYQTIELDEKATRELWISLGFEGEEPEQEEKERRIQDAFEEKYNRSEYNIWHRETRHIDPTPKRKRMDGRKGYIQGDPEDAAFDIMDYLLTTTDTEEHENGESYKEICRWIRKVLTNKPEWADAFIAVYLNDETIRDYAARIGADENNITQKLKRAKKKLRENYKNRQIQSLPKATT